MEMGIKGKKALVTGSTKGIGKAIALELAKEGADVLINGRKDQEVQQLVKEIKEAYPATSPQAATGDIVDPEQREKLFAQFPKVDILINNMGIFQPMAYEDIDDATWERFFRTNVLAANDLVKFYLPTMLEENFGRVIFIASEEAIMPGSTMTEGVRDMIEEMYPDPELPLEEKERLFMINNRPLSQIQRLIDPTEIGRLVAFVSSPYASAFSGAAIRMDGGMVPTIF